MKLEIEISDKMVNLMRKYIEVNEKREADIDLFEHDAAWEDIIDELGDDLGYIFDPLYEAVKGELK